MTGNIIVSTCCLGDMAVNAPLSSGCALGFGGGGGGGRLQPYHPRKHVLTITHGGGGGGGGGGEVWVLSHVS